MCAQLASCRCADVYPYRLSGGRIRQGVISLQLSLEAVSIFATCCNLSILPPPSTGEAIRRLISRSNIAGGLETVQTSTLLGPSNCGRCCHSECHDPSLHTAGEKSDTFRGIAVMIKEKQPWRDNHRGYRFMLHIIFADSDP